MWVDLFLGHVPDQQRSVPSWSIFLFFRPGGCAESVEQDAVLSRASGICKWFNVRMGFGFLSMSSRDGEPLQQPSDVFVHQVR